MTVTAHGSRRFHGSKEEPDTPTCLERDKFSLRALHPELYANIPSSKSGPPKPPNQRGLSDRIYAWLESNGDANAQSIATGMGYTDASVILRKLKMGVPGISAVGSEKNSRGNSVKVWGIKK